MQEMITARVFELSEEDLLLLEERDDLLKGWAFSYRVHLSSPDQRNRQLLNGLNSESPRTREHACDLIGDLWLRELRHELAPLFTDPISYVSEAANYNYQMLAPNE